MTKRPKWAPEDATAREVLLLRYMAAIHLLLGAQRVGSHRLADSALTKLEELAKKIQHETGGEWAIREILKGVRT